jgi:hypothetical protein
MRSTNRANIVLSVGVAVVCLLLGVFISWILAAVGVALSIPIMVLTFYFANRGVVQSSVKGPRSNKHAKFANNQPTVPFPKVSAEHADMPRLNSLDEEQYLNVVLPHLNENGVITDPDEKILRVARTSAIVNALVAIGLVIVVTGGIMMAVGTPHGQIITSTKAAKVGSGSSASSIIKQLEKPKRHKHKKRHTQTIRGTKYKVNSPQKVNQRLKIPIKVSASTRQFLFFGGIVVLLIGLAALYFGASAFRKWLWTYWIITSKMIYEVYMPPMWTQLGAYWDHDTVRLVEGTNVKSPTGFRTLNIGTVEVKYPGQKQNLEVGPIHDPNGFANELKPQLINQQL